ncbi:MAG: TlyA family RNA methyltransferase [Clostridiales bacterium]|nr:TlyA family RNA methyltransferase [Clostridiales bacterium]
MRADAYIASLGIMGRDRAKEMILSGRVTIGGEKILKPSQEITEGTKVSILNLEEEYVSRGGKKLEYALDEFSIGVSGISALDVGASTGGFTHCLLRRGAARVCALDSGDNQLHESLRRDERVYSLENTNIRDVTSDILPFIPDIVTVDVSFISLSLVFPALKNLGCESVVALIKPQFECEKSSIGKKGVVRDKKSHINAIKSVILSAGEDGYSLAKLTYSPLKGPEGNIEFLAHFIKGQTSSVKIDEIKRTVERAHIYLKG